ncbi:phage tail spike protein [Enterococcus sp. 2201sp1_2201st1_B8_2201SCRN_220225]|uniref:phage tail spike protein n=1 Tax=unclassified Enterococcus TaxID=2608891 RepID=UPI0034A43F0C
MLTALNLKRQKTAILQNAYNVSYEKQTNKIWSASFCLPGDDSKVEKVQQLGYVEIEDTDGEYIGLYRVMPKATSFSASKNEVKFQLRHVLSLLMDSVMFGYHEISPNTKTVDVLEYLLSLQKTKHWQLGKCEFTRYFQYSWENENGIINAIWSVPQPFDEEYMWTFDTQTYPWTLNLIKPPTTPTCRVREGHNLVGFEVEENPNQLINRIYPLGQGEGVNQLNIKKVNPTRKAYVENAASIAEYGLVEYVWVDRRFTDAQSLFSSANALLAKWKQPLVTWSIDAVDLIKAIPRRPGQQIPKIDELREGKVVQVVTKEFGTLNLRILKESKSDVFGKPHDIKLSIGYVPSDLGTTQSDVERNIEINQLYSQGATNILNYDKADNCDADHPVTFRIYIDDDVVKINTVELTFETSRFRAYSKAIAGGGAMVGSTASGGYTASSTSGGGASVQGGTSQSGGSSVQSSTSTANGSHDHTTFKYAFDNPTDIDQLKRRAYYAQGTADLVVFESTGTNNLNTNTRADNHTHNVSINIPPHTHGFSVNIPSHKHDFTVPAHVHQIELPDHTHEIEYGIFEDSTTASTVSIKVGDNVIPGTDTRRERFNLVPYLPKNEDGTVRRGWIEIEMTPNRRARIEAQITARVFIKSQLGGEF